MFGVGIFAMPRVRFGSRSGQSISFEGVVSRARIWVQRSLFICTRNARKARGPHESVPESDAPWRFFKLVADLPAGKFDETPRPFMCRAAFWINLRLQAAKRPARLEHVEPVDEAPTRPYNLSMLSYPRSRQLRDSYRHVPQVRSMHPLSSGSFAKIFRKEFGMSAIARAVPTR